MYKALIDADGVVINNIIAGPHYRPPAGLEAVLSAANILPGMIYDRTTGRWPVELVVEAPEPADIAEAVPPDAPGQIVEPGRPERTAAGDWVETWVVRDPAPADIAARLSEQLTVIKDAAEAQRQRFISPGTGKAAEYAGLLVELERYAADPAPVPDDYPYLAAGQVASGRDFAAEAAVVGAVAAGWRQVNAVIREREMTACAAARALAGAGDWQGLQDAAHIDWAAVDIAAQAAGLV